MSTSLPQDDLDLVLSLTPTFWARFGGARLFITGGTGFIGTWLLQVIQRANDRLNTKIEIVVLTRSPSRALKLPHVFNRADTTLLGGDVIDFSCSIGRLDLCIHAATDVGDPVKTADPIKLFDSIVLGTRHVLDLAQANGVSRFLLTSSGAIYGTQPTDLEYIPETYRGAPDSILLGSAYGNGKRAAEWLACTYAAQAHDEFDSAIARIFALIGPGLPLNGPFAVGNFIRDAMSGTPIKVKGDGRPIRSYLYMADLCVWLLRILESGLSGQAYNVGSEKVVSIQQLAEHVVVASGFNVPIHITLPSNSDALPPRYVPDTSRARQTLGLTEFTSLQTALSKTIEWNRSSAPL